MPHIFKIFNQTTMQQVLEYIWDDINDMSYKLCEFIIAQIF